MSEPFLGEIRLFAGRVAPESWAFCDGQVLPISGNEGLYSLLGITYGGDGRSSFALPDLRGRVPIHQGRGNGLSQRHLGETGGALRVALLPDQLPSHTHTLRVYTSREPAVPSPSSTLGGNAVNVYGPPAGPGAVPSIDMGAQAVSVAPGSALMHDNLAPSLSIHHIICLRGLYPRRD